MLPFKNDSLFWHSIWLSLGKPNSGPVFEVMKHSHNKYHYAVRRAKLEDDRLKSASLAEAAASENLSLFKEMKTLLTCLEKATQTLHQLVLDQDLWRPRAQKKKVSCTGQSCNEDL